MSKSVKKEASRCEIVQKQAEELAKHNVTVLTSTADLRQPQSIRDMMAQAQSDMGDVEILVNNAGMQHVAPVHEFEEDKWNDLIAVRVLSCNTPGTHCYHPTICCTLLDHVSRFCWE